MWNLSDNCPASPSFCWVNISNSSNMVAQINSRTYFLFPCFYINCPPPHKINRSSHEFVFSFHHINRCFLLGCFQGNSTWKEPTASGILPTVLFILLIHPKTPMLYYLEANFHIKKQGYLNEICIRLFIPRILSTVRVKRHFGSISD